MFICVSNSCDVNRTDCSDNVNRYVVLQCESPFARNLSVIGNLSVNLIAFWKFLFILLTAGPTRRIKHEILP